MNCSPPGSSIYGFSWQEYWSGLPFPSPGDHPCPGIEPTSSCTQGLNSCLLHCSGGFFTTEPPEKTPALLGLMSTTQWVKLAAAQHQHFAIFQILIIFSKSPGRQWTSPLVPLFRTIYVLEQWSQIWHSDGLGAAEGPGTYITLLNPHDGLSRVIFIPISLTNQWKFRKVRRQAQVCRTTSDRARIWMQSVLRLEALVASIFCRARGCGLPGWDQSPWSPHLWSNQADRSQNAQSVQTRNVCLSHGYRAGLPTWCLNF